MRGSRIGIVRNLIVLAGAALLWACAAPPAESQSPAKPAGQVVTAAQIFEQMQEQMRADKASWEAMVNSMPPYHRQGMRTDRYDMLTVQPEDWYATPEAKFAHSIKIPNPVPEDSGYRPGMSQREYFEHLCKTEAGEFIFRTVDDVEGIFQMRPRKIYKPGEWQHLYAIEDPYGYWPGEAEDVGFTFAQPWLYNYFEIPVSGRRVYGLDVQSFLDTSLIVPPPSDARIARYSGYDGKNSRLMKLEYLKEPKSRYGFTWRGIKRPHDREMGIAGGELIVLDLQTNEVLGVRRGYVVWNRGWTGTVCPRYGYSGGQDKTTYFTTWFVAKVVRPPRWKEFFANREKFRVLPPGAKPFVAE